MAFIKRFTGIKFGTVAGGIGALAAGPSNLTGSTQYMTQLIPCRGALKVVFRPKATNANALGALAVFASNDPAGTGLMDSASHGVVADTPAPGAMNAPGGVPLHLYSTSNSIQWDYVQLRFTTGASAPNGFEIGEVVVEYRNDADVSRAEFGQQAAAPVPA